MVHVEKVIVMFARASARYQGRIDAELSASDVVIMIRDVERGGDGSVLIHDAFKGLNPRNWMPGGSVMERTDGGLVFTHHRREEKLEIFLHEVYSEHAFLPELPSQLLKLGAEREFSDLLADNIGLIDERLQVVAREWRTPAGPVDLFALEHVETADGMEPRPVLIEIKRVAVDTNTVYQARRYLDAVGRMAEWEGCPARAVLVAPTLKKAAKELIDADRRLQFVRVRYHDLDGSRRPGE